MAATPERAVKNAVVKILKELGAYYFYPVTGGFGRSGVPDVVACLNGQFVGIECKAGKNKPTALQLAELEKIESAGGESFVVNEESVKELKESLSTACHLKLKESNG